MIKFKIDTTRPAAAAKPDGQPAGGPGSDDPIVVLDSGLGGLTVARAIRQALPHERVVYFGDTARLPYGSKAKATVSQYVRQIITYLRPLNPKHVVLACNTATAHALADAAAAFPDLTISGVIEPGARAAVTAAGAKRQPVIGVLATEGTVRSGAYERAILRRRQHARLLLRPAPLLAPIVEEGRTCDDPLVKLALEQYVGPMVERGMDVLVLGCTHYPILRSAIELAAGPRVLVIDSAQQCAQDVARRLRRLGLLRTLPAGPTTAAAAGPVRVDGAAAGKAGRSATPVTHGGIRCYVTDDPMRFAMLAGRFLGQPIDPPIFVQPDALYRGETLAQRRLRSAG